MKRPLIDSTEDSITPAAVAGSSAKMVPAGSVLCVMRSGILRHTFPVAVNTRDVTINQDMRALSPYESVDPLYISLYLQFSGQSILDSASKDGTTVNSIDARKLGDHLIPLVDLDSQRRVVTHVNKLFAEIADGEAALARARDDLATWRKALLKAAVTGELTEDWRAANPPAESGADLLARILADRRSRWSAERRNDGKRYVEPAVPDLHGLAKLPDGWAWASIAALLEGGIQNGLYLPQSAYGAGIPIVRIDDFQAGEARPAAQLRQVNADGQTQAAYSLRVGDIIVNRVNSLTHLAKSFLVRERNVPALFESNMMRMRPCSAVNREFFELYLASDIGRIRMCRNAKSAVNQSSVNQGDILETPFPLPPVSEQTKIVEQVKYFRTETHSECIDGLSVSSTTLRQSILAAAFRGELA